MLHRQADQVVAEMEARLARIEEKIEGMDTGSTMSILASFFMAEMAFAFALISLALTVTYGTEGKDYFVWILGAGSVLFVIYGMVTLAKAIRINHSSRKQG